MAIRRERSKKETSTNKHNLVSLHVSDKVERLEPDSRNQPDDPRQPGYIPGERVIHCSFRIVLIALIFLYIFFPSKQDQVSIAILPLDDLTGYPEQAYFVDGMHDALIGELGQVSALRVISRTSTLRYPKSEMLLQDIARELGVDVIVEGSVYGSGDSIRIQLQMIEAFPQERHIWAKEYHDDIRQALAIHSSVVRDIAREIRVNLNPR